MNNHALSRLRERYDENFTFEDLRALEKLVSAGEGQFVRAPHNDNSAEYLVRYGSQRIKVVFSHDTQRIKTALPLKGRKKEAVRTVFRRGRKYRVDN